MNRFKNITAFKCVMFKLICSCMGKGPWASQCLRAHELHNVLRAHELHGAGKTFSGMDIHEYIQNLCLMKTIRLASLSLLECFSINVLHLGIRQEGNLNPILGSFFHAHCDWSHGSYKVGALEGEHLVEGRHAVWGSSWPSLLFLILCCYCCTQYLTVKITIIIEGNSTELIENRPSVLKVHIHINIMLCREHNNN